MPVAALFGGLLLALSARTVVGQTSWEFSPYNVQLWCAASGPLPASFRQHLIAEVVTRAAIEMGPAWELRASEPPGELSADLTLGFSLVTVADIEAVAPRVLESDKLLLLVVESQTRGYVIRARELDCRTRTFGPEVVYRTRQLANLARQAVLALVDAFAAVVRIEAGEGRTLIARLRAGGLTNVGSPTYVAEGDILQPIIRQNDRHGKPTRIDRRPWTFLQVVSRDHTNPNLLGVRVHSGWRSPLRGRVGPRREQYALTIRPRRPTTDLYFEAHTAPGEAASHPLAGLEIYARRPSTEPTSAAGEARQLDERRNPLAFLGYTDWRGSIVIDRGDTPLRIIYVKSGEQLLARLPVVPGLDDRLVARIRDDTPRLQAEATVQGFESDLLDLVAQRQILATLVRRRIAENDLTAAEDLVDRFTRLPTRNDMQRRLDQQQNRQPESSNRMVQSQIDNLYAETRKGLSRYLDPSLGSTLINELKQARAASAGR